VGRPCTTAGGKNAHMRVQRVSRPGGYFFGWQFAWFEQREHCPQSLQTGPTVFRHFSQGTMFSRSAK